MRLKKAGLIKILLAMQLCVLMLAKFSSVSMAAGQESSDLMEGAEYEDGEAYHNEGDMILTADYVMPEDTVLHWYSGSLTIASGVTLTISEGSLLDISNPEDFFTVEKDACIRIEGSPEVLEEEEGNPVCHLAVFGARTQIDGTIESENAGILCQNNKTYLNGTIRTVQQFLLTDQCQIMITGGEYLSESKVPVKERYTDFFDSVIEISGGRFSSDKVKRYLAEGGVLQKQEDGTYEVVTSEAAQEASAVGTVSESCSVKERANQIWVYAQNLFQEAKDDSIQGDGTWINGDIVVVVLCVAVVGICLLLVIIDFIRSPLKKKAKILIEVIIAVGVVGGVILFLWKQVQEELQAQTEKISVEYEETAVPETVTVQNGDAELNGMEAYPAGIYLVGEDIAAGVYFFEAEDPVYRENKRPIYYVYSSKTSDFSAKEVGAWVQRSYLELQDGTYIRVIGANFVKAGEQPAFTPKEADSIKVYTAGEYLVGYDIEPGKYQLNIGNNHAIVRKDALQTKDMNFAMYNGIDYSQEEYGEETIILQLQEGNHLYVLVGGQANFLALD